MQHGEGFRPVRKDIGRRHTGGSNEVSTAILAQDIAAETAIIGNERIGTGVKYTGFADHFRAGRILPRENIERIFVKAELHVIGRDFNDPLRIRSEVGKQTWIALAHPHSFITKKRTGRILLLPIFQTLGRFWLSSKRSQ